jgi:ribonuclease Z
LKAGPLRAWAVRGETVTVVGKDGVERSVRPIDVVGASEDPGVRSFFVLCSNHSILAHRITGHLDTGLAQSAHIPSLVKGFESGAFSKYWTSGSEKNDDALKVVFHLCGYGVFEHEGYKAFMKGFKDDVHVSAFCSGRGLAILMRWRAAYCCI